MPSRRSNRNPPKRQISAEEGACTPPPMCCPFYNISAYFRLSKRNLIARSPSSAVRSSFGPSGRMIGFVAGSINMKPTALWVIGIGMLASVGPLAVEQANAGENEGRCTLATLRGLYMFAQSGYTTVNGSLVPEGVTGKAAFHGSGTFDSLATISIGGTIMPDDAAPGTYTVNSDCTGTVTVFDEGADTRRTPGYLCRARRQQVFHYPDRSRQCAFRNGTESGTLT